MNQDRDNTTNKNRDESVEIWKSIEVHATPIDKSYRLGVFENTTPGEILDGIMRQLEAEKGFNLKSWATSKVGNQHNFILLRKFTGNEELAPHVPLREFVPTIGDDEEFQFDVRAVVG